MRKPHFLNTDNNIFIVRSRIAETYDIDPTLVRLVMVSLTLVTFIAPLDNNIHHCVVN